MKDEQHKNEMFNFFPILMINALIWALVIAVNLIVFYKQGLHTKLFPLLLSGTVVAVIAVSKAWALRKKTFVK